MNCSHQIKKNDMGNTCSTNEGEVHIGFCWGNPRERNDLEDLRHGQEDNIKLELQKIGLGNGCIVLAQDGDRWNAVVKAEMDLPVP